MRLRLFFVACIWITSLFSVDIEYSYIPKYIHPKQLFSVTIKISKDKAFEENPVFRFADDGTVKVLDPSPLITRNPKEIFYTFYFKAEADTIRIPTLFVQNESSDVVLRGKKIPLKALPAPPKDFCGVLASKLSIKNAQVSNFDENDLLVLLELEGAEANLEDFDPKGFVESGLESLRRKGAKTTAEFYAVIPKHKTVLSFSYYDTLKRKYVVLSTETRLLDTSVVGQSDLDPKNDAYLILKKYALLAGGIAFLLLFLWKRDWLFLLLSAVSFVTLGMLYVPHKKVCVPQGAPLYILPTHTSTIGAYMDKQSQKAVLSTHESYKKIELREGIIAWVKEEDLCE